MITDPPTSNAVSLSVHDSCRYNCGSHSCNAPVHPSFNAGLPTSPPSEVRFAPGHWEFGSPIGLRVRVTKKPRWLTRKMAKFLLELEWRDYE